ncbi:hypothetical protein ACFL2Z_04130 [Candidatus Eisenbacteria bacterium]|uniref:DUF5666 domain-containing protein n=1 Tax=Eiseniibacteriota bacterium TaxID=2212470 RepID=A0ABV6YPT6_UNCEI
MSWLGFSLAPLLVLLPLISFAQAHLCKYQSFRAFDTGHSGGDHICDLRRDSDGLGRPDRLGDYVTISGSVIAEPSTYETGGWLFWVRHSGCGILVYGEQASLRLGDSVRVGGWLRLTNGGYFFPETGLASLGDVAIGSAGVRVIGRADSPSPNPVTTSMLSRCPERYGGDLIRVPGLTRVGHSADRGNDSFVWMRGLRDSVLLYFDGDTGCVLEPGDQVRIAVTGILIRMDPPGGIAQSPSWCLAPRSPGDIVVQERGTATAKISWGDVKQGFLDQD